MGKNKDLNENEIKEELEVTQEAEDTQPTEEEKLISEIAVLKDKSLRLQADFDNFRKRNASVVSKTREETTKDVLTDLLTVADNLERAMTMITDENTKAGIQLVMNQLNTIFEKYNVTEMQSLGEEFDPNYHNATTASSSLTLKMLPKMGLVIITSPFRLSSKDDWKEFGRKLKNMEVSSI